MITTVFILRVVTTKTAILHLSLKANQLTHKISVCLDGVENLFVHTRLKNCKESHVLGAIEAIYGPRQLLRFAFLNTSIRAFRQRSLSGTVCWELCQQESKKCKTRANGRVCPQPYRAPMRRPAPRALLSAAPRLAQGRSRCKPRPHERRYSSPRSSPMWSIASSNWSGSALSSWSGCVGA